MLRRWRFPLICHRFSNVNIRSYSMQAQIPRSIDAILAANEHFDDDDPKLEPSLQKLTDQLIGPIENESKPKPKILLFKGVVTRATANEILNSITSFNEQVSEKYAFNNRWMRGLQLEVFHYTFDHVQVSQFIKLGEALDKGQDLSSRQLLIVLNSTENGLVHLNPEQQWKWYKLIRKQNLDQQLSLAHYQQLIRTMVASVPFNETNPPSIMSRALVYLKNMKQHGISPDHKIYSCLYRAFKDNATYLSKIHDTVLLDVSNQKIHSESSVTIVSEESFRTLLASRLRGNARHKLKDISPIWYDMKNCKIKPSLDICVGFLEACQRTKDERLLQEVHKYLGQIKHKYPWDDYLYARLMLCYASFGRWLAVQRLGLDMRKNRMNLSRYHYRALLISGESQPFLTDRNYKLAASMVKRKIVGDDDTYRALSNICSINHDRSSLRKLVHAPITMEFESRRDEFEKVLADVIALKHKNGEERKVVQVAYPITRNGLSPMVFYYLIRAYSKCGDLNAAIRAFDEWEDVVCWLNDIYKKLLSLEKQGLIEIASHTRSLDSEKVIASNAMLRSIVLCSGMRLDVDKFIEFMETRVFSDEIIRRLWKQRLINQEEKRREEVEKVKSEIKQLEEDPNMNKPKYEQKKMDTLRHFEKELGKLEKQEIKHVKTPNESFESEISFTAKNIVGVDGVFSIVYQGFSSGWKMAVDHIFTQQENDQNENPESYAEISDDESPQREEKSAIPDKIMPIIEINKKDAQERSDLMQRMEEAIARVMKIEQKCVTQVLRDFGLNVYDENESDS